MQPKLPTRNEVKEALEAELIRLREEGTSLDVITFSGNGEPTLHPDFEGIMKDTCALRNKYCQDAKVSVLSNSTQLSRPDVINALRMADNRILKLDSAIDKTLRAIDQPLNKKLTVVAIKSLLSAFNHDFTLQTCFLKGRYKGVDIDNTTKEELQAYYHAVEEIAPKDIMIYVIDRATPCKTLEKISPEKMLEIATVLRRMGFTVTVCS